MSSDDTIHDDLVDALSRGRLTLSELAVVRPDELDALFELACERLDADRIDEAAILLSTVVALFPYAARYWRAYGIALQRRGEWQAARVAYESADTLEPEHQATRCYRGEVALYTGDRVQARADLEFASTGSDTSLAARARDLLARLEGTPASRPRKTAPRQLGEFTLTDHTPLPLSDGRYSHAKRIPLPIDEVSTITQVAGEWLDSTNPGASLDDITHPRWVEESVDRRRIRDTDNVVAHSLPPERTAQVRREPARLEGDGDTARIRRGPRPVRTDGNTDLVTRVRLSLEFEQGAGITEDTALRRRRDGLSLLSDHD